MMEADSAFERDWKLKFPGVEVPKIKCFSDGSASSIQQSYDGCEQKINAIREELRQQEFLKEFLLKHYHKYLNVDKGRGGGLSKINLSPGQRSNNDKFELDSPVPIVDLDPFDDNNDSLYKAPSDGPDSSGGRGEVGEQNGKGRRDGPLTTGGGRRGVSGDDDDDSEASVGDTLTFTQGITGVGCLGGKGSFSNRGGQLNNRLGLGRVRKGATGEDVSSSAATEELGKNNFKNQLIGSPKSDKRITVHGEQGITPNNKLDNVKAPLVKTGSVPLDFNDRGKFARLSQKNRPPVPLPRPSVKGPVYKGLQDRERSPSLERKLSERTESDNSLNSDSPGGTMEARGSPNPGRQRYLRNHVYTDIEFVPGSAVKEGGTDSGDSLDDFTQASDTDPGNNSMSRIRRHQASRQRDYVNVTLPGRGDHDQLDAPIHPKETSFPATTTTQGPPMLKSRGKVKLSNTDSGSSASVASREEENAYDNPNIGQAVDVDDSSSEDDEPIYFNIMQLRKEALQKQDTSQIYASINIEKKGWEREKKEQGIVSPLLLDQADSPPVPHKSDSLKGSEEKKKKPLRSANSVDSVDSVFSDGPQVIAPAQKPTGDGWKKRGSMHAALTEDSRSISSLSDDGEGQVVRTVESEKLHMRKWVVTSILDSEQSYVAMLGVLLQYMRSLEASAKSSQPVISEEEVKTIFFNIPDLHRIHSQFVNSLEPLVENWNNGSSVGAVFKIMALEEYPLANAYCQNYQKATACLQRCSEMHVMFHELVQKIKCKGTAQSETLEEMLHKPVVRVQRNTLVLHDLIKFTPTSHGDYDILQKTLKITQQFLDNFQAPIDPDNTENQRYLVKNGMIVEMERNRRKLRQVFLFNDVLVIAKQKLSRQRLHFECKVFIPLTELLIEASQSKEDTKMAAGQKDKVEKLKKRVSELQAEMRAEVRKNQGQAEGRQWSMRGGRNLEKIRKKLTEQEVELFRESPNLVFRLRTRNKKDKPLTLLMSSDYERTDWRESITGLQIKQTTGANSQGLTLVDLQNLINSIQRPKINVIGAADGHDVAMEEEHVYGSLSVTVNRIQGLKVKADTFCCIEVDSYGHFFMKAKTNIIASSSEPKWDEEFEIDLDGAQTLRMLAYKMNGDTDVLLGRGALELSKAWLKGRYQDTTVSLNEELSLTVSMKYTSREQTLKRTPSSAKGGLFGVKISSVTKRESRQVPLIVTTCVEEVERRGLDDLGIYRISGLSSEIQRLKKAFERNVKGAIPLARETDTHVLACLLKLYFRELPEALFTDKLYPSFVEGLNLSDPEAKESLMVSLLQSLPEPNYTTIVYLLNHMMTISKNEGKNKMSINNLATVFGPTLLRPAVTSDEPMSMDMFSAGARDAMLQTGILLYFLNLKKTGFDFEKRQ